MMRVRTFALLLCLLLPCAAPCAERTHDIGPDDYATVAVATELAVSPDGKQVAYCLAVWDAGDDARKTDLWVVATDGKGKPARLTFDRANDRHPRWSADGRWVYFLGNRKREAEKKPPHDGTVQVWRVRADGSDLTAVTRVEGGVTGYDYAPEADTLFFSKEVDTTDEDDFSKLRAQFGKVEYGHGKRKVSEVHRLDLGSWRSEKVIDPKRYVREFAVTSDGKRVGMVTALDDTVIRSEGESRVDVWEDGKVVTPPTDAYRKEAASPYAWLESLAWSADGQRLAFCAIFDAHPAEVILMTSTGGKWTTERMKRPEGVHVRGYGSPLKWGPENLLGWLGELQGLVGLRFYDAATGKTIDRGSGGEVLSGFDYSPGGKSVYVLRGTAERFPEVAPLATADPPLTDLNPQAKTWNLPSVRHITWKGADGSPVGGVLELPAGYRKGDKLPLVVAIHGGPTTSVKAELVFDPHNGRLYFSAKGYAVLCPNYRGSTGYGDKFVTDLIGNENDLDVKDILAGIRHLIDEGIADPERVGVMGWSNGGYLTNCLITLKDSPVKIRAASSGGSILDTVAEWGFNDEPAYPIVFKKGLPWEQPEVYRKSSPTYGLGNATTPTVIHVGGNDDRCPPGHSRMLYRALKEYRKVPAELIVYPGEPHGLMKLTNRRAKMEWDLAWFEKYLKGRK